MTTLTPPAAVTEAVRSLPVVVIGAGPVGLAAAAHLTDRGLPFLVLEAGPAAGASVSAWGHIRTFTPWRYIIDPTAEKLLAPTGWTLPGHPGAAHRSADGRALPRAAGRPPRPTGSATGTASSRCPGTVWTRAAARGREDRPFLVRVRDARRRGHRPARPRRHRRLGHLGRTATRSAPPDSRRPARRRPRDVLVGALPDVLGARPRTGSPAAPPWSSGAGHSAANTLLALARLAATSRAPASCGRSAAATRPGCTAAGSTTSSPPAAGSGTDLRALVESGAVELRHRVRDHRPRAVDGTP